MINLIIVFKKFKPDIILHLAAQSLVRKSYREPYQTLKSNVVGTMNVLESIRLADRAVACLVVTSDKCYDNKEWLWGYRETEPLGERMCIVPQKQCVKY